VRLQATAAATSGRSRLQTTVGGPGHGCSMARIPDALRLLGRNARQIGGKPATSENERPGVPDRGVEDIDAAVQVAPKNPSMLRRKTGSTR
jgi:hypothetical protein